LGATIDSEKRLGLGQVSLRPFFEHWGRKVAPGALKHVISMGYTTPYRQRRWWSQINFLLVFVK